MTILANTQDFNGNRGGHLQGALHVPLSSSNHFNTGHTTLDVTPTRELEDNSLHTQFTDSAPIQTPAQTLLTQHVHHILQQSLGEGIVKKSIGWQHTAGRSYRL